MIDAFSTIKRPQSKATPVPHKCKVDCIARHYTDIHVSTKLEFTMG